MYDWCHSGLEGYCKSAAALLADQVEIKREANTKKKTESKRTQGDVQLQLCRELLPDRTEGTLTRAWTMSNVRQGRANRLSLFEKCWLGDELRQRYFDEVESLTRGVMPEGGYATIPEGSSYQNALMACANKDSRKRIATSRLEADAIEACVGHVRDLLLDEEASEASSTVSLVLEHDFPVKFFTMVIPAIERGLLSERYRSSDIRQFVLTLNGTVYRAHNGLKRFLGGEADTDLDPFFGFVTALFAGLIYGPDHPLAVSRQWDDTPEDLFGDEGDYDLERREGTTIRVTQVFDDAGIQTGYSELFRPMQVVFFGRSPNVDQYLEQCESIFPEESDTLEAISVREKVVYPIAYHLAVSNKHAMMLCQDDVWWLYDLESTNGTSVATSDGIINIEGLAKIEPGDRIRMGIPAEARGANVYYDAATLLVTLNVDLAEDYV